MKKNLTLATSYFLLSSVITWWFIRQGALLYLSPQKMLLSCSIAGAKWSLQILAALFFLQEKKWFFIRQIGFTCFVGSCLLLPYCLLRQWRIQPNSFVSSLIVAVLVMIFMYYKAVSKTGISKKWFWAWIGCLAIAVLSQIFIVF
ncbi:MAG: hypothetical protein ABI169_08175 [Chitinophagaceae bacterium]